MKKRSLATILVVTFALFISTAVISEVTDTDSASTNTEANGNGNSLIGNSSNDVNGVYVPD